jgi:sugar lactone lactonase YvrE
MRRVTTKGTVRAGAVLAALVFTVGAAAPAGAATGTITTIAGRAGRGFSGDGGPATAARLSAPRTMATDASGNVYFVDTENNRVRRIDAAGIITTIGGTGVAGFSGDGGPAIAARLNTPHGIAVDASGNVFVADPPNHRIRRISPTGTISTVAGNGAQGYNGDGRPATTASLAYPKGVEIGPDGLLYIADTNNQRVRRVDPDGRIRTVAGTGTGGFSGDGGPATSARFRRPRNLTFDGSGDIYVVDEGNHRVRRINAAGIVITFAGTGRAGYNGDSRPATTAWLNLPRDVAVDAAGVVYIAEERNHRIRSVDPSGVITTFAGTGVAGYSGDGGPADAARIAGPRGVAVDAAGRVLIADTANHRIRRVG